jgi:hypothetical protein
MVKLSQRLEKFHAYVESHVKRVEGEGRGAGRKPAITLSRETGAGAVTLGDRLADYLNKRGEAGDCPWTVFDKNLVKKVLEDHELPKRLEKFMPEDKPSHVEEAVGDMLGLHPPNWELVKHTYETIYRLAKLGHCILVGRGANIITCDLHNVVHLRLVGSLEKRVAHCMDYYGITNAEAGELVKREDRARRRYLLAYYDVEIDDPTNYHLVINVDKFDTQRLVKLIGDLVSQRRM